MKGIGMDTTSEETLSSAEREFVAAMVERMRQLRRRSGVPNGMTLVEAVALHIVSAEEVARARWGDAGPPAPTEATQEGPDGIS